MRRQRHQCEQSRQTRGEATKRLSEPVSHYDGSPPRRSFTVVPPSDRTMRHDAARLSQMNVLRHPTRSPKPARLYINLKA